MTAGRWWRFGADGPGSPRRAGPRHRGAVVAGAALVLVGAAFGVAAGLQEAEGGYVGSGSASFSTPTAALTTREIDVRGTIAQAADPANDVGDLARVRIVIRPTDPDAEMFVGVGPTRDVRSYLRHVAHDEFEYATLEPFEATFHRSAGSSVPADPRAQTFWVASSAGSGEQTVEWDKRQGAWSLLVVRADGGAGLAFDASIGLRFGFLAPIAVGALSAGLVTLAGATIARTRRRG